MDPVLIEYFGSLEGEDVENSTDLTISLWIAEDGIIRPSSELAIKSTLEPGVYHIDVHRDYGIHCKKVETCSDELFLFTDDITNKLINEINTFWSKKELYKKNNLIHKRGILLEGYPGTGKTSIISLLSKEIIKKNGIVFKITSPKNLFYYNTFVKDYFRKIQPDTPIITIIEDIDSYLELGSDLLNLLDGENDIDNNLIIATSNNMEDMDDTFLRPSRIDLRLEIPLPNKKIREEYFNHKKIPKKIISELIEKTEEFSLADLKELYICIQILGYTIDETIAKIKNVNEKKNYLNKDLEEKKLAI